MSSDGDGRASYVDDLLPREEIIDGILKARAPLLALAGDSGIGKSTLLRAAAARWRGPAGLIDVRFSESAPHAALSALAQCMTVTASRADPVAVVGAVVDSAREATQRLSERLPFAVCSLLLSLVETVGGPAVRLAVETFAAEVRGNLPRGAFDAADALIDPLAVDVIGDLQAGLLRFVEDDETVLLSLDGGERFAEEQLRFLADLAESAPARCLMHVAFRTTLPVETARLRWLESATPHCSVVEIPPLTSWEVEEWLVRRGLSPSLVDEALRRSGGYPLHLVDLMDHLLQGNEVASAPRHERFNEHTRQIWAGLEGETRRKAGRLAVLNDPLPLPHMRTLLEVSQDDWFSLVEDLETSRLFSVPSAEGPWFHEERRLAVVDALSPDERGANHDRAAELLAELVGRDRRLDLAVELSLQVERAPDCRRDPVVDSLFALDDMELSLLAATLEVSEPSSGGAVDVIDVVSHWSERWARDGDPTLALARLREGGALSPRSSFDGPGVVLDGRPLLYGTALGLAARRLGRVPIPSIGSYLFQAMLAPALSDFDNVTFGIGRPRLTRLATEGRSGGPSAPGIAVRLSYESTPFFAAAWFSSAAARDEAAETLTGRLLSDSGPEDVQVRDVTAFPVGRLQSYVFERVVERVARPRATRPAMTPKSITSWLTDRASAVGAFAKMASPVEAMVADADAPAGFLWTLYGDTYLHLELRGPDARVRQLPPIHSLGLPSVFHALDGVMIHVISARTVGGRAEVRGGLAGRPPDLSADPVTIQFAALVENLRRFNQTQPRTRLIVEPETLERTITAAWKRRWELSVALHKALSDRGVDVKPLTPTRSTVMIVLDAPSQAWVAGAHAWVQRADSPATGEEDEVQVEVVQGVMSERDGEPRVELPPGLEDLRMTSWSKHGGFSRSVFHYGIAHLLGYDVDDLATVWPD